MCGGASASLVRTVIASDHGSSAPARDAPSRKPLDTGLQHRDTTVRVHRHHVDAQRTEHTTGAADGGRDVVHLQIEKRQITETGQRADCFGARRGVELETDLGDAEIRPQLPGESQRQHQVVDIERDGKALTNIRRDVTHDLLHS